MVRFRRFSNTNRRAPKSRPKKRLRDYRLGTRRIKKEPKEEKLPRPYEYHPVKRYVMPAPIVFHTPEAAIPTNQKYFSRFPTQTTVR